MELITDLDLMVRVAEHRDKQAFEQLHQRYVKSSYNLAMYLLRDAQLAEDVAQDSLSRVWISASSFKTGSVRSWILCIVAREAIRKSRRKYRKREGPLESALLKTCKGNSPDKNLEHGELLACLRDGMSKLSDSDRNILGLYFGAGLTQAVIAEELSMPQRTVSFKLKNLLDELRAHLVKSGVVAAVSLLESELLAEAMTSGHVSPLHLGKNALRHIDTMGRGERGVRSSKKATAKMGTPVAILLTGLVVVAASMSIWKWKNQNVDTSSEIMTVPKSSPASSSSDQPRTGLPHFGTWNFNVEAPPKTMKAFGRWRWFRNLDRKKGFLAATLDAGKLSFLTIPITPSKEPFLVTVAFKGIMKEKAFIAAIFGNDDLLVAAKRNDLLSVSRPYDPKMGLLKRYFYVWDKWIVWRNGEDGNKVSSLIEYPQARPGNSIILCVQQSCIFSISVSAIQADEFPFDPERLLANVSRMKKKSSVRELQIAPRKLKLGSFTDHSYPVRQSDLQNVLLSHPSKTSKRIKAR